MLLRLMLLRLGNVTIIYCLHANLLDEKLQTERASKACTDGNR